MRTSEAFCRISSSSRPFSFTVVKISNAKINKCLVATDITFLKLRSLKKKGKETVSQGKQNRPSVYSLSKEEMWIKKVLMKESWHYIIFDNILDYSWQQFSISPIFRNTNFWRLAISRYHRSKYRATENIHTHMHVYFIYIYNFFVILFIYNFL